MLFNCKKTVFTLFLLCCQTGAVLCSAPKITENPLILTEKQCALSTMQAEAEQDSRKPGVQESFKILGKALQPPALQQLVLSYAQDQRIACIDHTNIDQQDPIKHMLVLDKHGNKFVISTGKIGNEVCVWDRKNPAGTQRIATLIGHKQRIWSCERLTRGTEVLATGSEDGEIRLWNITKEPGKECVAILRDHGDPILVIKCLNKERTVFASISWHGEVQVWDITKEPGKECVDKLPKTTDSAGWNSHIMPLDNDGNLLLLVRNGTFRIWDRQKRPDEQSDATAIGDPSSHRYCLLLDKEANTFTTAGDDENIRIWNRASKICIGILRKPKERKSGKAVVRISSIAPLDKKGTTLVSGSDDGTVCIWNRSKEPGEECTSVLTSQSENKDNPIIFIERLDRTGNIFAAVFRTEFRIYDRRNPPGKECIARITNAKPIRYIKRLPKKEITFVTMDTDNKFNVWQQVPSHLKMTWQAYQKAQTYSVDQIQYWRRKKVSNPSPIDIKRIMRSTAIGCSVAASVYTLGNWLLRAKSK